MPRLFATEGCTDALHFFEHVLITNVGTQHLNSGSLEGKFQSHVRHSRRHDRRLGERTVRLHLTRRQEQNGIAVYHLSLGIAKQRAVGIAVKSNADVKGPVLVRHEARQGFRVQRTATVIDVLTVWR